MLSLPKHNRQLFKAAFKRANFGAGLCGSVLQAELPQFPQTRQTGSAPVRLFDTDPAHFYAAQAGWVSASGAAPNHQSGFVPAGPERQFALADGQDQVVVPFVWQGPDGVSIRRTYTLTRGSYAVEVRDEVVNQGSAPWQGQIYRQLIRKPPLIQRGYTHPESFSFTGAAWYDGNYQRRKFGDDYLEDGHVNAQAQRGWIAMLQHHFFSAWIPEGTQPSTISLDSDWLCSRITWFCWQVVSPLLIRLRTQLWADGLASASRSRRTPSS